MADRDDAARTLVPQETLSPRIMPRFSGSDGSSREQRGLAEKARSYADRQQWAASLYINANQITGAAARYTMDCVEGTVYYNEEAVARATATGNEYLTETIGGAAHLINQDATTAYRTNFISLARDLNAIAHEMSQYQVPMNPPGLLTRIRRALG